ncbi:NIPSNAP family containing protein [Sphingopyxis sp. H038]|uniref:NIPSNAP family protein n=1 Tax=unclassified Sphingopyxis TaxID=2614943 RepID=UPI00072FF292|nr:MULTISPECIES: NIPSNAP family protein [unclassified Sphingopyxis]KTE02401.1 NIPSNAP family containing protein [Sphingopyxis sp. H012]KTE09614.1 NIPSNAP family containing protein [Sphingopyxis sp. H093]KTE10962.1 NIPSNAP family containing protein [Sphingopyxis sp. H053]KTE26052.1 NIPSNAP family containing protein [Sphingopyxis sp. H080]KTE35450.1 NIPSNAP family containing protein [Sphingopyxis sp. H038]
MPSPVPAIAIAAILALAPVTVALAADHPAPLQQLRIYEIPRANEGVFHDRFRDHALRIMARHGFAVRSIWRSEHEDKVEFVYLLDWPDVSAMDAAWAAFLADPEWIAIKKETAARDGKYVESVAARTLEPVAWSPDRAKTAD